MHNVKAIKTKHGGVTFASKGEAAYAAYLDRLVVSSLVEWWTPKVTFYLGTSVNSYRPDFLVKRRENHQGQWYLGSEDDLPYPADLIAVDFKGRVGGTSRDRGDATWNRNKKLWAAHGPIPLVVVTKGPGKGLKQSFPVHQIIEGGGYKQSGCGGVAQIA